MGETRNAFENMLGQINQNSEDYQLLSRDQICKLDPKIKERRKIVEKDDKGAIINATFGGEKKFLP